MPVSPEFSWEETEDTVQVFVQLPGVSRQRLDVFATSAVIKINAPPYFFIADLAEDIDDNQSVATIDQTGVTFRLVKVKSGIWGKLLAEGDHHSIKRRRNASIEDAHKRLNATRKAALENKQKLEKLKSDQQFEIEQSKRRLIEQKKQDELKSEASSLKRWQASLHDPSANDSDTDSEGREEADLDDTKPMPDHPAYYGRGWRPSEQRVCHESDGLPRLEQSAGGIWGRQEGEPSDPEKEQVPRAPSDDDVGSGRGAEERIGAGGEQAQAPREQMAFRPLPPPRQTMEPVEVEFTRLQTDTLPAREHREIELKQYKKQQQERASAGTDAVDVAERQPVFLKDKGSALFAQGNFRGAVNAYSRALQLDPEQLHCLSNRAACWLKLGEPRACLEDCDAALGLLRPRLDSAERGGGPPGELQGLSKTFVRLLARKGAAHCQLEELQQALSAYEEAAGLNPGDEAICSNVEELRAALAPADAAALRRRGDHRFAAGDPAGAAEAYTALLSLPSLSPAERIAALSNRAAARLRTGDFQESVKDCNEGLVCLLEGLGAPGLSSEGLGEWVGQRLLPRAAEGAPVDDPWGPGRPQRVSLQRLLARRGAAFSHMRLYGDAAADLTTAAEVCRSGGDDSQAASLRQDADRVRQLAQEARPREESAE